MAPRPPGRVLAALALALLTSTSGPVKARDATVPSVGETVDATVPPWTAIGRVNNSIGGSCTGVLVSPDRVLTAAHCVYNERTGIYLRAEAIHVLLGFARGTYVFHGRAAAYRVADGYHPDGGTVGTDYAVITLEEAAPEAIIPLRLAREPAVTGTRLVAVGYGRGRPYVPTVLANCVATGHLPEDEAVLATDCVAPDGYSGGPLLDADAPGTIVGLQVARQRHDGELRTLAVDAAFIDLADLPTP